MLNPARPRLPSSSGDPYADLLSGTRKLRREHRIARDAWFGALPVEGKDDALFELEVLLKASACFANPRNHPGPPRQSSIVTQDFRDAAVIFHDGMQRAIALSRQLLGPRDRAFVFHRYLETVLPEDNARTRLFREGTSQNTPEESLIALRHTLTSTGEVVEGVLRAQRVPYRLFYAVLSSVQREVAHNAFFNPLNALEFRPEFDRIRSTQVLDLIRSVPGAESHRLVALTFLSLFRMLRYVRLLSKIAAELGNRQRKSLSRAYLVLSVLRSDARALSDYLRQKAGSLLAESFERDLMVVPSHELERRSPELRATGHRLIAIKSALEGIAGNLRLEMRRTYRQHLPAPTAAQSNAAFRAGLHAMISDLRPALRTPIMFLGKALGVSLEEGRVFDDHAAAREMSERLRRDVWMFAQIVRAFSTKAQQTPSEDRWAAVYSFEYVREFLAYFRAMGYPLLRASDYPRFDTFMAAMEQLQETDLVDPARLETAINECTAFYDFLLELFHSISKREVLGDAGFDRRAAASALRLYIGD